MRLIEQFLLDLLHGFCRVGNAVGMRLRDLGLTLQDCQCAEQIGRTQIGNHAAAGSGITRMTVPCMIRIHRTPTGQQIAQGRVQLGLKLGSDRIVVSAIAIVATTLH